MPACRTSTGTPPIQCKSLQLSFHRSVFSYAASLPRNYPLSHRGLGISASRLIAPSRTGLGTVDRKAHVTLRASPVYRYSPFVSGLGRRNLFFSCSRRNGIRRTLNTYAKNCYGDVATRTKSCTLTSRLEIISNSVARLSSARDDQLRAIAVGAGRHKQ